METTQSPDPGALLYEGKAKRLYTTDDPDILLQVFKDDLTAFDAVKRDQVAGKGAINNAIATRLFSFLHQKGIDSHYVEPAGETAMLVRRLTMLPLEVVVRNIAAGSLVKRLGRPEGEVIEPPIIEFYLKNDALHDPILSEEHIRAFGLATREQVEEMKRQALTINDILTSHFAAVEIRLVDFKLEFGVDKTGRVLLADEITPDTCRLWDITTGEKLDKDRFRFDLGDVKTGYAEVLERLRI